MSLLLLDAGNSRIKWRYRTGNVTGGEGSAGYETLGAGSAPWNTLAPRRVLASVVNHGGVAGRIVDLCRPWGLEPGFARTPEQGCGVVNGYRDPAQLGVDRWLALVAARATTDGDAVVVDCGTAITADLLRADGVFDGGMILPGRELLTGVFAERVPHLAVPSQRPAGFPGRTTADCIALGVDTAIVAALERFIDNAAATCGGAPRVLVTGGDTGWLTARWSREAATIPNLVLDGLQLLAEQDA